MSDAGALLGASAADVAIDIFAHKIFLPQLRFAPSFPIGRKCLVARKLEKFSKFRAKIIYCTNVRVFPVGSRFQETIHRLFGSTDC